MQRPGNLDTASSIVLLQEETTKDAPTPKREYKKNEANSSFRYSGRGSSLSFSNHNSKNTEGATAQTKKGTESSKGGQSEDKLGTLMSYRRAKGLCYKCGMKWNPGHKCANTVSLHVVEEMWQMVQGDASSDDHNDNSEDSDEDLMALSVDAIQGTEAGKTVRMVGDIFGKEAVILIDSGSSHSFISAALVSKWKNLTALKNPMKVRVANGQVLLCTHEIVDCPVWICGFAFKLSLKVLPFVDGS